MLPVLPNTFDRESSVMDTERRIRLLANIAAAQAEFGQVEEVMEACKIIARLRDKVANAGTDAVVVGTALQPSEA